MNFPSGWELVLVVLVIMLLFGAKRLPDSARSLGRSMRIFKSEVKGMKDDDRDTVISSETPPPAVERRDDQRPAE